MKEYEEMVVNYRRKKIAIPVQRASAFGKLRGLMFRSRQTNALLFDFRRETTCALHSLFVFFPFLVLWLDEKNNVRECRIVRPFTTRIVPSRKFWKAIEIPFSLRYRHILEFFVGKGKV